MSRQKRQSQKTSHTVTIEKLVAGGKGLGHLEDGRVVLVPFVLPGEKVTVAARKVARQYLEAVPQEIVSPSPHRAAPLCPVYGRCGGCDFQHVQYSFQAYYKEQIVRDLLARSALGPEVSEEIFLAPLSSPSPFQYRQRIRLQVDGAAFGFFRPHSHVVEPISECPLARPEINHVLKRFVSFPALRALLEKASAFELQVSPADGWVVLILHARRKPRPADRQVIAELFAHLPLLRKVIVDTEQQGRVGFDAEGGSEDDILIRFALSARATGGRNLILGLEPGGFCQVNLDQNEQLVRTLLEWAEFTGTERVLDLYCGMGNFSLPMALWTGEVVGFDLQRSAIRSAGRNALACGLGNLRFERSGALEGARALLDRGERFDCILLDPPRQGCQDVMPLVAELGVRKVIYISCDPATLVRDLALLSDHGFVLRRLQVVDMFPQTHHVEVISCLDRKI